MVLKRYGRMLEGLGSQPLLILQEFRNHEWVSLITGIIHQRCEESLGAERISSLQ